MKVVCMRPSNEAFRDEYDEEKVLNAYITSNLSHYLGELENRGYWLARKLEANRNNEEHAGMLQAFLAIQPDEVIKTLKRGSASIFGDIKNRIRTGQLSLNRCPECNRIVRTPNAKQCLWCGHDWHHARHD